MQVRTVRGKGAFALLTATGMSLGLLASAGAQEASDEVVTEPGVGFVEVLNLLPKDVPDTCDPSRTQVRLTVHGMLEGRGIMTAEVYENNQRGFLNKRGRIKRVRVPAQRPPVTVCMNVEPGTYAAVAYHDIDGDRDLDQKWNRLPAEPFALSGDRELKFGFPDIEPSLFDVPAGGSEVDLMLVQP